jgi:putative spermidine/putrescine transport system substrate-binding protein
MRRKKKMKKKKFIQYIVLILSVVSMIGMLVACNSSTPTATTAVTATQTSASVTTPQNATSIITSKRNMVIIDPGGEQDLLKPVVEGFKAKYPDYVGDVQFIEASTGETVTKLKAEQQAGTPYTTFVVTGYDALSAGIDSDVYVNIPKEYPDRLKSSLANLSEDAKVQMDAGGGYGIPHLLSIGGPMFTFWPDKVPNPPKNLDDLLAFAKANPGKFSYPHPSNSGAGYAWLQGIPYLLGEENPGDPTTWTKVWPYLKELDKYIDYYTPGSSLLYREFNEGSRWLITTAVGYETNQRVMGAMVPEAKQLFMDKLHWVTDANFYAIPKGLDPQDVELGMLFIEYSLSPEIQPLMFDGGFMYPGPVITGITLADAPQASQDTLNAVITQDLINGINNYPHVGPMSPTNLVKAFQMWDEQIGTNKIKQ